MRWLADGSPATLGKALRAVAPELSRCPIVMPKLVGRDDPLWHASSAVLGGQFVAKFVWSHPAALRIAHEIRVLTALARVPEEAERTIADIVGRDSALSGVRPSR